MDPESCLQMIIDLLEDASNPDFWNDEALSVEDEVGYLARCLRDWLTRGGFAPDEREPHAGFWFHRELAQDLDMRMAGAQQDDIGSDGSGRAHKPEPSFAARVADNTCSVRPPRALCLL